MKRKFTKILGVGLTLALLTSLLLTAAPVSAVTTPVVTLTATPATDAYVISKVNTYKVLFTLGTALAITDEIVVVFDEDIDISALGTVTIAHTPGIPYSTTGAAGTVVVTEQTLTIPLITSGIGAGAMVQVTIPGVTNPDTAGKYNLTVGTQTAVPAVIEAAVTSAAYTIKVPTIAGLPGVASVYNPTGVLMAQENDLQTAINQAGPGYTIHVGPGTYDLGATPATITIGHEGLTLVSTDGAATTIIDATGSIHPAIHITASDVTFDGFTLDDFPQDGIWIQQGADDVTIQNNIFIDGGPGAGIVLEAETAGPVVVTGAAILDNVFEDNFTAIVILAGATDNTISGNTITGCTDTDTAITLEGGSAVELATQGNTITGNTITDNAGCGIRLYQGLDDHFVDNVISGNTISGNAKAGIEISDDLLGDEVTGLQILNNDITDNEGDGILIAVTGTWDPSNVIKFNTITGNDTSTTDYGIDNDSTGTVAIDAALNWWGTTVAADITAMVSGSSTSAVTTAPFLTDTADAVFSASETAVGAAAGDGVTLNASTTVGVAVSVSVTASSTIDTIAVAKYTANPEEALADAIAFYDVYVAGTFATVAPLDGATIKFYAGDTNTEVYIWSASTLTWGAVTPVNYSAYGGYVYVTVDPAMLGGTPFALVAGAGADLGAPTIATPDVGEKGVSLTPTFSWEEVTNADAYYFELADNANFVLPLAKLDGDLGRLIVTAYAHVTELSYSTPYYWRVKAVSGTVEGGDLGESPWASGVFITEAEAEAELWMCSEGLTFDTRQALEAHLATAAAHQPVEPADIIVEPPDIIVPLPAETPITPAWIYVIIGVGAVLVTAVIVLIVRTRRVA